MRPQDMGRARHTVAPESNMLDWLTWPADQLLRIGGVVAGWFFSKDATSFTVVQMMFATLVLAVQSRSVVESAMLMLHSGRPYGTDSSRQRQDHARRPSCYTAIEGFDPRARQPLRS